MSRGYLLDTHVWLWLLSDPGRLVPEVLATLAAPQAQLYLSAASCWELAIKYRIGKLSLPEPPERFVPPRLVRDGVTSLPVQVEHALHVSELPGHHRDPFDRLLVAQAALERLTLVTADAQLEPYGVPLLWAHRGA